MKFAKHIHVLQLLSTVPDVQWDENCINRMSRVDAIACWDHLFAYIHENWVPPKTATTDGKMKWDNFTVEEKAEIFDCGKMLQMSYAELEEKLESLPPYFAEHIFPVAVARYLLLYNGGKAIPLDHRKTVTFKEFYKRYGEMILGCWS